MADENAVVAIYPSHAQAEAAIRELQSGGFDMKKLSIIGKDFQTEEHVVGYYNIGDRMKTWGTYGAFWGWIWGVLFGSAFFFVPGFGPILVAGPIVAAIVAGLESAVVVGSMTAIGAALVHLGIPTNSILKYETELKAGKFMVVAHGAAADTARAREVLAAGSELTDVHAPAVAEAMPT